MKHLLPVLVLALLAGCPLSREKYNRTPGGWHVHWQDQGTVATGIHSPLELFVLFDQAMAQAIPWCANYVNLPADYVAHKLRDNDALYTLVDDFFFPVPYGSASDAPTATAATGETFDRIEVEIAFWNRDRDYTLNPDGAVTPTMVPATAPSWTLKASVKYPGLVYYGVEIPGSEYPALGYELHWQFTTNP